MKQELYNQTTDPLVRYSFLKATIDRLRQWFPFTKTGTGGMKTPDLSLSSTTGISYELKQTSTNELGISKVDELGSKNIIKISDKDITVTLPNDKDEASIISVKQLISERGIEICKTYTDMIALAKTSALNRLFYLDTEYTSPEGTIYKAGIYKNSLSIGSDGIGTNSPLFIMGASVDMSNYYTKDEVNNTFVKSDDKTYTELVTNVENINTNVSNLTTIVEGIKDIGAIPEENIQNLGTKTI